jgi:hypothetical protein
MTTPVLFLDETSKHTDVVDSTDALTIVRTLLETLKRLRKFNKKFALNTAGPIAQYEVSVGRSLQSILGGDAFKEEWDFIRGLSDRSPFASGLEDGFGLEIEGLELRTRSGQVASSALAWAMLLDSATVSFDGHHDWSQAWVETSYSSLEDDGSISTAEGQVRNASQAAHADVHYDWLNLLGFSETPTATQVWNERADRFPGLRFLLRTEKDLYTLEGSGTPFLRAISSLETLAKDVANWKSESGWPDFSTKATPESTTRQNLCLVTDDVTGNKELFHWHTRFTGGLAGRVHFKVNTTERIIVVGYIGGKLDREISN